MHSKVKAISSALSCLVLLVAFTFITQPIEQAWAFGVTLYNTTSTGARCAIFYNNQFFVCDNAGNNILIYNNNFSSLIATISSVTGPFQGWVYNGRLYFAGPNNIYEIDPINQVKLRTLSQSIQEPCDNLMSGAHIYCAVGGSGTTAVDINVSSMSATTYATGCGAGTNRLLAHDAINNIWFYSCASGVLKMMTIDTTTVLSTNAMSAQNIAGASNPSQKTFLGSQSGVGLVLMTYNTTSIVTKTVLGTPVQSDTGGAVNFDNSTRRYYVSDNTGNIAWVLDGLNGNVLAGLNIGAPASGSVDTQVYIYNSTLVTSANIKGALGKVAVWNLAGIGSGSTTGSGSTQNTYTNSNGQTCIDIYDASGTIIIATFCSTTTSGGHITSGGNTLRTITLGTNVTTTTQQFVCALGFSTSACNNNDSTSNGIGYLLLFLMLLFSGAFLMWVAHRTNTPITEIHPVYWILLVIVCTGTTWQLGWTNAIPFFLTAVGLIALGGFKLYERFTS